MKHFQQFRHYSNFFLGVIMAIMTSVFVSSCDRIDAGNVGLKVNMSGGDRGVSSIKYVTGWVWYMPGASKVIEVPIFVQHKEYEPLDVYAKGGIQWRVHPSINYQVVSDKADLMYQKFRVDLVTLEDGWMKNVTYQVCRDALNTFDSDSLLNHRELFEAELAKELTKKLAPYFIVSNVTSGLTPPGALTEAIRNKTVAIQNRQSAENQKYVIIAEGETNIAKAKADSTAQVIGAKAEAEVIKVKQEQLKQSPAYIDLIKAEKWNGQLPQIITGGGNTLMQLPGLK